ncbi:hypothetical protein chiPu_0031107 [Chiloscyllium punctatum]|uniref:Uncharacterized protein n=1 Tax=Chiloscyllium punctatum TaxID=137246 RepID=A0A401TX90_CHIPU|nr:hypothetical protein [Chiloscyllium punctatum]
MASFSASGCARGNAATWGSSRIRRCASPASAGSAGRAKPTSIRRRRNASAISAARLRARFSDPVAAPGSRGRRRC